jgi:hypothetical protein
MGILTLNPNTIAEGWLCLDMSKTIKKACCIAEEGTRIVCVYDVREMAKVARVADTIKKTRIDSPQLNISSNIYG